MLVQLLIVVDDVNLVSSPLREKGLEYLEGGPVDPVGPEHVKVAQPLAVEVLQHSDHLV